MDSTDQREREPLVNRPDMRIDVYRNKEGTHESIHIRTPIAERQLRVDIVGAIRDVLLQRQTS